MAAGETGGADGPDVSGTKAYRLHLFVAGTERNSRQARENLDRICSEYMTAECELVVTDVLENFKPALEAGVYVTPALVIDAPLPRLTVFGNLSDTEKLLDALGLEEAVDG